MASTKRWSRLLALANSFSSAIKLESMVGGNVGRLSQVRDACRADSALGRRWCDGRREWPVVLVALAVWFEWWVRATICMVLCTVTVPSVSRCRRLGGAVLGETTGDAWGETTTRRRG